MQKAQKCFEIIYRLEVVLQYGTEGATGRESRSHLSGFLLVGGIIANGTICLSHFKQYNYVSLLSKSIEDAKHRKVKLKISVRDVQPYSCSVINLEMAGRKNR